MAVALLLAAALAWWLHSRGELVPNIARFAGAGAAGLIALRLLQSGRPFMAVIAGGIGYVWWLVQAPRPARRGPGARAADGDAALSKAQARALLGVGPGADAEAIQAAWRARIAEAHPDAGGSDEAARAVTAARDLLLARRTGGRRL